MKKLRKTFGWYIRKKERDRVIKEIFDEMKSMKRDFFKESKDIDDFIKCLEEEIKSGYYNNSK